MKIIILGASSKLCKFHNYFPSTYDVYFQTRTPVDISSKYIFSKEIVDIDFSQFDVVINLIGVINDSENYYSINCCLPREIYERCCQNGVRKFIHISSVGSYGAKVNEELIRFSNPKKPINSYEISKAAGEELLNFSSRSTELIILYPSNVVADGSSLYLLKLFLKLRFVPSLGYNFKLNFVMLSDLYLYILNILNGKLKNNRYFVSADLSLNEILDFDNSLKKVNLGMLARWQNIIKSHKIDLLRTTRHYEVLDDGIYKDILKRNLLRYLYDA